MLRKEILKQAAKYQSMASNYSAMALYDRTLWLNGNTVSASGTRRDELIRNNDYRASYYSAMARYIMYVEG